MSNSELIDWLKKKAETVPMPGARKMYEAAAKALEAQKHMISRQAVLDVLNNIEIPRNASWYQYYQQALTAVDKLPPAPTTEVATDINVATKDGTNLAEVGTDLILRQAAIDALCNDYCGGHQDCKYYPNCENLRSVQKLPPAQPEIIRCRNCKFASGDSRICMKFGHSPIGELDFCSFAERREVNHESN